MLSAYQAPPSLTELQFANTIDPHLITEDWGFNNGYTASGAGGSDNARIAIRKYLQPQTTIYIEPGYYMNVYAQNMREDGQSSVSGCAWSGLDGNDVGFISFLSNRRGDTRRKYVVPPFNCRKHGFFVSLSGGLEGKFGRQAIKTQISNFDIYLFRYIADNSAGPLGSTLWCIYICRDWNILRTGVINPHVFDVAIANANQGFEPYYEGT